MTNDIKPEEIDDVIKASILHGVATGRLPPGFTLSPHAYQTIKDAVWLKLEQGKDDDRVVTAMIVSFNIGFSEGKYDGLFEEDEISA